jgi:hypothetical protein
MARPDRLIQHMLRTRYLITLNTEETFDGVLLAADERHLVIADAETVGADGSRAAVDGQLWLPRHLVKYMQHLTA